MAAPGALVVVVVAPSPAAVVFPPADALFAVAFAIAV